MMNSHLIYYDLTYWIHFIQDSYTFTDNPYLASIPEHPTVENLVNASSSYSDHVRTCLQRIAFDIFLWMKWTLFHWVFSLYQLGFFIGLVAVVIYNVKNTLESLVFGVFLGRTVFLIFYICYYRCIPTDYIVYYYIRRYFLRILVTFEIIQYVSVLSLIGYRFGAYYPETLWAITLEGIILVSWYLLYYVLEKKKEQINALF